MSKCPVFNDPIYVKLSSVVGPIEAYSLFNRNNGDIEFLKDYDEESIKNYAAQVSHVDTHSTPLNHLKIYLEKRLNRLRNSKASNKEFVENNLKRQRDKLSGVDEIIGISQVVDYLYDEAIGEKKDGKYTGHVNKLNDLIARVKSDMESLSTLPKREKEDRIDSISKMLQQYYDYSESLEHIEEYRKLYTQTVADNVTPEEGSTLWKMGKLLALSKDIKEQYKETILPLMAKKLDAYKNIATNEAHRKEFEQTLKKLEARQKKGEDVSKALEEAQKRFEDNYVTEESLLKRLKVISKDVPLIDKLATPMISLGDYTLSIFDRFVKKEFFDARLEYDQWKRGVAKQYKKFIAGKGEDKVHILNKDITEVVVEYKQIDGEWIEYRHNSFVQEIDESAYNLAWKNVVDTTSTMKKGSKEYKREWGKFFKENREPLHINTIERYGRKEKGVAELVSDMEGKLARKVISQDDFDTWVFHQMYNKAISDKYERLDENDDFVIDVHAYSQEMMSLYHNHLSKPEELYKKIQFRRALSQIKRSKYQSAKYTKLSGEARAYHAYMVEEYFKSQSRLPESKQLGYILPYRYKSKRELILEGKLGKAIKTFKEESFKVRTDDTEYGDPEGGKQVPIYYTTYIPAEESSLDVMESIVGFEHMSKMYEAVGKIEPTANAYKVLIKDREVLKEGSKGNILSEVGKQLGIEEYVKKNGVSNASEMIDWYIEQKLYNELNLKEKVNIPGVGEIDAGKTISSVMSAASLSMLGGPELLKSVANSIQAKIQRGIEAASKEYVSTKDLVYGESRFMKHSKDILNDFASTYPESYEGQWLEMVDFMQGNFKDMHGGDVTGSAMKKLSTSGSWMFMNNFSEYQTQASMAFALANTVKLKLGGKTINLLEAYELKDGTISLKEGVTKEDGGEWGKDDLFNWMGKLHALNKRIDGVYNTFDRPLAKRWSIGRLLLMFKGFLIPTVKRRFKSYGGDQELGGVTEGFYRTFYKAVWKERGELMNFLMRRENHLTDMQRSNIRRAVSELTIMGTLMVAVIVANGMEEDDEELKKNWAWQFMLYELTRAQSELTFYQPGLGLGDQMRLFQSPSAMNGFLDRSYKFAYQTLGYSGDDGFAVNDVYKRAEGWHEKGDSKWVARLFGLLGFNGNNTTPSQATEIFHKL